MERNLLYRDNLTKNSLTEIFNETFSNLKEIKYIISSEEYYKELNIENSLVIDSFYTEKPNYITEHIQIVFPIELINYIKNKNNFIEEDLYIYMKEFVNGFINNFLERLYLVRSNTIEGIWYSNDETSNFFYFDNKEELNRFLKKIISMKFDFKLEDKNRYSIYINIPAENIGQMLKS